MTIMYANMSVSDSEFCLILSKVGIICFDNAGEWIHLFILSDLSESDLPTAFLATISGWGHVDGSDGSEDEEYS